MHACIRIVIVFLLTLADELPILVAYNAF